MLVSRWDFEGDATDSVGPNDGTLVGDPLFGASLVTSEPDRQAIVFDGTEKYVEVPNDESLQLTEAYWLTAWVERGDEDSGYILVKGSDDYYLYMYAGNGLEVAHRDADGTYRTLLATTPIRRGHKVRIDGVFDGAELRLYINGILRSSAAQTNAARATNGALRIGSDGSDNWNGRIDKVRVHDAATTSAEILAEYRAESPLIFEDDFSTGDTSLWTEEQIVGTTAALAVSDAPPAGMGDHALRCELGSGDERAELRMSADLYRFVEGDDAYFRFLARFADGFPVDASTWGSLFWQLHNQGSVGSPVVASYAADDLSVEGDIGEGVVDWQGPPVETDRTYEFVVRVLHSAEAGLVEVWLDGSKVATSARQTLVNAYNYFKTGYYRDTALTGTGVVWIGGFAVARSNRWASPSGNVMCDLVGDLAEFNGRLIH